MIIEWDKSLNKSQNLFQGMWKRIPSEGSISEERREVERMGFSLAEKTSELNS